MDCVDIRKCHIIYKTTCLITGRWYIGMHSTNNLDDGYLGSGKRLWYSIKKYGEENHIREIVEVCTDRKSLAAREKKIVNEELLKEEQCLNLIIGGDGGWSDKARYNSNTSELGRTKGVKGGTAAHKKHAEFFKKQLFDANARNWQNKREEMLSYQKMATTGATSPEAIARRKETFVERGHQQGEKNSNFGKRNKCVSKDGVTKRIPIDEVENYLADGWVLGIKKIPL